VIVKAVNRSSKPKSVEIKLSSNIALSGRGTAEVLTSSDLSDENSFEQPRKVAPVMRELTGLGRSFVYTFDGYSVTVLRIEQQTTL
jgi:alpha-L-arabinofuranosidase